MPGRAQQRRGLVHDPGRRADEVVLGPAGPSVGQVAPAAGPGRAGRAAPSATAHSSAADDDRPAPSGTSPSTSRSTPRTGDARPRAAPTPRRRRTPPSRPAGPGVEVGDGALDVVVRVLQRASAPRPSSRRARPPRRSCGQRERQHEAVVVVGVLADQVDPAGRRPDAVRASRAERARRTASAARSLPRSLTRGRRRRAAARRRPRGRVVDEHAHARLRAGQVLQLAGRPADARTAAGAGRPGRGRRAPAPGARPAMYGIGRVEAARRSGRSTSR